MCDPCTKHNTVHAHTQVKKVKLSLKRIRYAKLEDGMSLFQTKKEIYVFKQTSSVREDGAK